ncbi:hypothetical protein CQW23_16378 [Capsicum baccatum]|uniref:Peptidase A1 domain-containing protein n=1 Tax=Capsicum baccatum TaxID=33114 RepID=A0A2G2WAS1_CAPBA|nr:hypothetical protein CQW23_16378 [Capsicum baccatum]
MSIDLTKLPDPPMPSYTFTLFSRDLFEKSKFNDYDSLLESKLARCQARADHLASILANGNVIGANGTLTRPHGARENKGTCVYDLTYEDKSRTKGWIAEDVITFVLDQNRATILFGCGKDQMNGKKHFSPEYSGIAGIGRRVLSGGYSLPSQFEADIMAMCLPGIYSGKGSTISFHTTPFKITTSAKLLPNSAYPHYYFVNLYKVFINDKEIPLNKSIWNSRKFITGGCIVDTGTTITRFPRDFYTAFRDTFIQQVQGIPLIHNPRGHLDTCYKVDPGVVPNFPVVKMYFGQQNPNNLLLLTHQRVMFHLRGIFCLAFGSWDQDSAVLGSNQLQRIGLTFNTAANTLSFDLDACD